MREYLIRKVDRCIECRSCVLACERRHGRSRMTFEGKRFGCVSIPNTCKSCADPKCITACKKEAVRKVDDRVYVDMDKCVGCGLCQKACPYDAIEIVDLNELEKRGLFRKKKKDQKKRRRSFKCDLCSEYGSSACVEACPNRALERCVVEHYNGEHKDEVKEFLNNPPEKPKKKKDTSS